MTNTIEIVVTGKNLSGPAMAEAKRDALELKGIVEGTTHTMSQYDTEVRQAAIVTEDLTNGFKNADTSLFDFTNKLKDGATFSEYAKSQLSELRAEAKSLGEEFNRTGDIDVLRKLRENYHAQGILSGISQDLAQVISDGGSKGKTGLFKQITSGATEAMSAIGSQAMPILVGAVVATAPLLGAAVAAGVLGGIATGGIATGIIGQINSPAVQNAAGSFASDLSDKLHQSTLSFQQPIVDALDSIKGHVGNLLEGIDFGTLSKEVGPLVDGIGSLIEQLGPGINDAISASEPVLQALADVLPDIGQALSDMLSDISDGGDGAADAMRTVGMVLVALITIVGRTIEALSKTYSAFVDIGDAVSGFFERMFSGIPGLKQFTEAIHETFKYINGDGTNSNVQNLGRSLVSVGQGASQAAPDIASLSKELKAVQETADTLAGSMADKLFSVMMGLDQATLSFAQSQTNLDSVLKENKKTLDVHTVAGQNNTQAILSAVQANIRWYDANIQAGMSAQDAAAAYDANTQALRNQLTAAGLTSSQVDGLIGKYAKVPDSVNTTIVLEGLASAIRDLNETLRLINGLHDKTVHITMAYSTTGTANSRGSQTGYYATGGIRGAAVGGPQNGWTWVGEEGPELLPLPSGTQIMPASTSRAMADRARGGDGGTMRVELVVGNGGDQGVAELIAGLLRSGKLSIKSKYIIG